MVETRLVSRYRAQPEESPFDGPLGSFLDAVVRFEDGLSRLLAPLARRGEAAPRGQTEGWAP